MIELEPVPEARFLALCLYRKGEERCPNFAVGLLPEPWEELLSFEPGNEWMAGRAMCREHANYFSVEFPDEH